MALRVLIVDDDPAVVGSLHLLLENAGLDVDTAGCYEQAMQYLAAGEYAAVIVDFRLAEPECSRNGLCFLEQVSAHQPQTHRLLMTGYGGPEVMKEAYRLNAHYYLEKPFAFDRLAGALCELGVLS